MTKPMLSVLLLAHVQILLTLLMYLRLLHSHQSLKHWTILPYLDHWLPQPLIYRHYMAAVIHSPHYVQLHLYKTCIRFVLITSVHRPQTFQELLTALTQIKIQSLYLPSVSHPLLCYSPALSWFSGYMIFLLMPWVYTIITNYSNCFAQEMPSIWNSFYPPPTPTSHLVNSYWSFSFQFRHHVFCHMLSTPPRILYVVTYLINISLSWGSPCG